MNIQRESLSEVSLTQVLKGKLVSSRCLEKVKKLQVKGTAHGTAERCVINPECLVQQRFEGQGTNTKARGLFRDLCAGTQAWSLGDPGGL